MTSRIALAALCALASLGTSTCLAQPDFEFTRVVDPLAMDSANFNTIQGAVEDIPNDPSVRYTVLIYAGVYEEEVTLDVDHSNVDLVGVDPDAVIIKPPLGDNGVVISGFGARNNTIRNLTILIRDSTPAPSDLDGILITKPGSGTDPSGVTIDNVKIRLEADGSRAVRAAVPVSGVVITDATIECIANAGSGIVFEDTATAVTITGSAIRTTGDDAPAIHFEGRAVEASVTDCTLDTAGDDSIGVWFAGDTSEESANSNLHISGVRFHSTGVDAHGVQIDDYADGVLFERSSLLIENPDPQTNSGTCFRVPLSVAQDAVTNVEVLGVVGRGTGHGGGAIYAPSTDGMRVVGCDFLLHDGNSLSVGNNATIDSSSFITRTVSTVNAGNDNAGLVADEVTGLVVRNSLLEARKYGVNLKGDCDAVRIEGCVLRGSHFGLRTQCGDGIEIVGSMILGDSSLGVESSQNPPDVHGVCVETISGCDPGVIRFTNCEIVANSGDRRLSAYGVYVKAAPSPTDGPVTFENCTVSSSQAAPAGQVDIAQCYGVAADEAASIEMIGGSVSAADGDEREHEQYDLRCPTSGIAISGTEFSKWLGPIGAAVAPSPMVQRTIAVPAASNTAVNGPTTLTGSEQTITGFITQPQGYRVLKLTLSQTQGADYTAIVIGDNAAGERIADAIKVSAGQTSAQGAKPFLGVTKIILPAGSGTASIGTTDILGLEFPIASGAAVQQQGKMAPAGTAYTIGAPGTVDDLYATVDVSTITTGDSFEWAVRASR
ncbi:MAG: hypothetical protein IT431_17045 [Phycisphaerales bacterium]|nr:hypothetical protein [Phycisphaerales bacterium]